MIFKTTSEAKDYVLENFGNFQVKKDDYSVSMHADTIKGYYGSERGYRDDKITITFSVSSPYLKSSECRDLVRGYLKLSALTTDKLRKKAREIDEAAEKKVNTAKRIKEHQSCDADFAAKFWAEIDPEVTLSQEKYGWFSARKGWQLIAKFYVNENKETGERTINTMEIPFHIPTNQALILIKDEIRRLETKNA